MNGYPIFSITEFNGSLYGCGEGKIYRLDTGTNFDGVPIVSFYETHDSILNYPFFDKTVTDFFLDAERGAGRTIDIGLSVDGSTFTSRNINIGGTERLIKTLQYPNNTGNVFGFRMENAELDKGMEVHRFGVLFTSTKRKSGT